MKFIQIIFLQLLLIAFTGKFIGVLILETNCIGLEKKMIENDENSDKNDSFEKNDKLDDDADLDESQISNNFSIVEIAQINPRLNNRVLNRSQEIKAPPPKNVCI